MILPLSLSLLLFVSPFQSSATAYGVPPAAAVQQGSTLPSPPPSAAPPHPKGPLPPAPPTPALDRIRAAHSLNCAVSKEEEDYSRAQDHGNRALFDLDLCKAAAVAILGPGARFTILPYPDEDASIEALRRGEADLVASATPRTRFRADGVLFSQTVLMDQQGFLIKSDPAVHSPLDLADKKVCYVTGTPSEEPLHQYAEDHHISYIWFPFSEEGEMYAAFFGGNCAAITSDVTKLANVRNIARGEAVKYTILTDHLTFDPLSYASLSSDPSLAAVLDAVVQVLVNAEAMGITSKSAPGLFSSTDTRVARTVGQRYSQLTAIGLEPHWGANVIVAVGNYGEMFERDLGSGSPLRLERGPNKLVRDGGLLTPVYP